jgi:CubicO group peptidase (beta-lactamase class C family)
MMWMPIRLFRWLVCVGIALMGPAALPASEPARADQHYPAAAWERVKDPERLGWSVEALRRARDFAATIDTAAVMIVWNGRLIDEWGETTTRFNLHSIRKSLLSALYGIHVREGRIDLGLTIERLGIDDNEPSLTAEEKQATLLHLLQARSGVYHPALYESASMKAARPKRWSHAPGAFWYYNNWDFNVLGTVFERLTKTNLFAEFKARIADPIGMQDFRLEDGAYVTGADSVYPAYPFRMTARDLARFGLLYLRNGQWRGRTIVPADWVRESTRSFSDAGQAGGYGYLWWIAVDGRHFPGVALPDGSYSARGSGGHNMLLIPGYDLLIVHRVNTDIQGRRVDDADFGTLVSHILAARPAGADGRPR